MGEARISHVRQVYRKRPAHCHNLGPCAGNLIAFRPLVRGGPLQNHRVVTG